MHLAALGICAGVSRNTDRKVKKHASHSNSIDPDRRGCLAMARESFHSHGEQHQVHLERRRRDRCRLVAPRRVRIVPLTLAHTRGITSMKKNCKRTTC